MKVKKNDTVLVITGKDSGKTGKVLVAYPKLNRISVEGINVQKRSKKARSAQETSAIVEQCGPIDASNVLVVCPQCKKATRVAHSVVGGKKVRVCKKCGAVLDTKVEGVKAKKANDEAKKTAKKVEETAGVKETAKKTTKKAEATAEVKDTAKKTTAKKTTKKAETEKAE